MKKCDFCGKELTEDAVLSFSGENIKDGDETRPARICSDCIKECYDIMKQYTKNKAEKQNIDLTPDVIKADLDEWVIGQESAKKTVATEVYNHLKRIKRLEGDPDANKKLRLDKSNIILVGPSGTGKTEMVRALGDILDIPYTIQNATSFTASGYVGLCR